METPGFVYDRRWVELFLAAGERHLEYRSDGLLGRLDAELDPHVWVSTYEEAARRLSREAAFPPRPVDEAAQ